jgi:hypothetical protein
MATPLIFKDVPYGAGAIGLVFGGSNTAAPTPATVTLQATMPAPSFAMTAVYDNRLTHWLDQRLTAVHEVATELRSDSDMSWGVSKQELGGTLSVWEQARRLDRLTAAAFAPSLKTEKTTALPWGLAASISSQISARHEATERRFAECALVWQMANPLATGLTGRMETALKNEIQLLAQWQLGRGVCTALSSEFGRGFGLICPMQIMPWESAARPSHGGEIWPPPEVLPPAYLSDTDLLFQCPPQQSPWVLVFGALPCYLAGNLAPLNIFPARFYMTTNTVEAQLLPSLADVPIYAGATISQDVGSFAWTLSATGPASLYSQLAAVPGQPKILRVTINGIAFVFQLDSPKRTQSFGNTQVQLTGRSVTATLGTGFARETTRLSTAPSTAQQLAAQALLYSGVALDWGMEDWLVPAGSWSHSGTPLAAVQAIAEAAGGYVQSHRTLAQLMVRHPYPLLPGGVPGGPWNWAAATAVDVVLAPDAIISRSQEVRPAAAINAVYVSGAEQGVLALVKRAGSAGDLLASMVVDPLITANAAAAQRGTAVLGAAGDKLMHQLELPVLTGLGQPGILSTDQLIEVQDAVPWRGRVRAVTVTHDMPRLRQTVLVEAP